MLYSVERSNLCPESDLRRATFNVVACEHTTDNAPAVVATLGDCDIVAIELLGVTSEERRLEELMMNSDSVHDCTDYEWNFGHAIASEMRKRGATIRLIDANLEDEDVFDYGRYMSLRQQFSRCYEDSMGDTVTEAMKEAARRCIDYFGITSRNREAVVSAQLADLARDNPSSHIGVVVGAMHTAIIHELRKTFEVSRSMVMPDDIVLNGERPIYVFPPELNLDRAVRFGVMPANYETLLEEAIGSMAETYV